MEVQDTNPLLGLDTFADEFEVVRRRGFTNMRITRRFFTSARNQV